MKIKDPELKLTPKEFGLKGNISSMSFQSYHVKKGLFGVKKLGKGAEFLTQSSQHLKFKNNKLVMEEGQDIMDDYYKNEYEYNNDGDVSVIKHYSHHPLTKLITPTFRHEYNYLDNKGLEDIHLNAGEIVSRMFFTIENDLLIKKVYGEFNELKERHQFIIDKNEKIHSKEEYTIYDVEFCEGETEYSTGKEFLASRSIYNYDNNGFLKGFTDYTCDEEDGCQENYKMEYLNDSQGNPLYSINYEPDGIVEVIKFTYKYDNQNNWIERKQYGVEDWNETNLKYKSTLKYVVERQINYE
ncbi:hypothetical protein [Flavobacterium sp.]|uniref:hypothetical protein n=1 Tax=Flavobacterium sp. TaxID=239 RepID=UPI00261F1A6E|nr:hypothetical protein [Flavobacterium sp.]